MYYRISVDPLTLSSLPRDQEGIAHSLSMSTELESIAKLAICPWVRYNETVTRRQLQMAIAVLTIPYPEELLSSLKKSPEEFETEARLLLAVKLYEN